MTSANLVSISFADEMLVATYSSSQSTYDMTSERVSDNADTADSTADRLTLTADSPPSELIITVEI